ncbi:uncharacterized protein LOC116417448 [Nasonia vitripennis]|uniref:Uncharacterized protein n=1 Tax=Nasonia vitripennis TaxID=7425 RepID=A0A7M7QHP3_NASVI|nr:uncharacterized protein LOC116417448 [Nasonia vitripennis]
MAAAMRMSFYICNVAPSPWDSVKSKNVDEYNSWTLFRYSSIKIPYIDSSLCQNLYFDKTRDLHGHVVNLGVFVQSSTLPFDDMKVGLDRFGGVNGEIAKEIWTKLNANASVKFYKTMGTFDAKGNPVGFYEDLRLHRIDYAMNMIFFRYFWKLQTYPHESSAICIISYKDRSTIGSLRELLSTITSTFWIIVIIGSVILNIALKFLLNENISSSCLELLRMIISVSSLKEPQQYTRRFFFAYIIVLTMMTNFYFQSSLSSISIAPSSKPVIDSEESLLKSDLIIYGRASMRSFLNLSDPKHKERYVNEEFPKCAKRLLQGQRVACISGCISSRYNIYEGGRVHISEEKRHTFMSFAVRDNWPLYFRVNQILRRMSEGGLIVLFRRREMRLFKRPPRFRKSIKRITMRDANFAFYVWNVGVVVSSCVFMCEIFLAKIKTKISVAF